MGPVKHLATSHALETSDPYLGMDPKMRKFSIKTLSISQGGSRMDVGSRTRMIEHTKNVENTYQLEPKNVFQSFRAKRIAESIVKKRIPEETEYESTWAKNMSLVIANEVRRAVKSLPYDRYRYVVQTYIGQKRGQGVQCSTRSLMEAATDTYDEYLFENKSLWCVVIVHAIYLT